MEKNYVKEIEVLFNAGARVIEVVSYEWQRVHGFAHELSQKFERDWYTWSSVNGISVFKDNKFKVIAPDMTTLPQALQYYLELDKDMILVLEDFHPYISESNPVNIRFLRELARDESYKGSNKKNIILSSPSQIIPDELSKELPVITVELPNRDTLEIIANQAVKDNQKACLESEITSKLLESALGLTVMEAKLAFSKAIIKNRKLTEEEIPLIISEKEQIIKKSGLLEYYHNDGNLSSIGGLENLKTWIRQRGNAYSDQAKKFGLTTPRGVMLLGVPGCGKSLTAKAIADEWKFPLLRFDLGKVFGGIVGESERNIRYALDVAKTISPCVLWIDEIEKGLSGSKSSGQTDSGTAARVFGTFLTWMQEKKEPVFVVATANDISQLPPELLRKGRFDEIFFVDLPSEKERENILNIHLTRRNRDALELKLDMKKIVSLTEGFSGAELEEVVTEAMFEAFSNNQTDITTDNIINCINLTSPLSRTMSDVISNLRKWSNERARLASNDKPSETPKLDKDVPILEQESHNPFFVSYDKK